MKRKSGYSFEADCATLMAHVAKGKPQPVNLPFELHVADIQQRPKVFQHRSFLGSESESHVRSLAAAIKKSRSKVLDPILVWWSEKGWACLDGHHRYAAYLLAEVGSKHPVPVEVFLGTIWQAMGAAGSANTKNKLQMSTTEKSNTAWSLVAMTDLSKAEAAKVACVSESTVANMRKVFNQFESTIAASISDLTSPPHANFRDLSWAESKRIAEGRDEVDFDWAEANENKAQAMALTLRKSLGAEGARYPEVFARALDIYSPRLPEQLAEYWDDDEQEASEF